jgi:long-chain acyl-CoA synthetase
VSITSHCTAPTLDELMWFDDAVANTPDKLALRYLGTTVIYRELGRAVMALAQRLAETVAPGEVVALVVPDSMEFRIAYFAALKAGAVPAVLDPLHPAAHLAPLLRGVSPKALICTPATQQAIGESAGDLGISIIRISVVCSGRIFRQYRSIYLLIVGALDRQCVPCS